MVSNFVTLEGKSRSYRLALAILAALALAGFISFVISYLEGHQTFGSSNIVP